MKIIKLFYRISFCLVFLMSVSLSQAQVKLSTDFTSQSNKKLPIHDVWNVSNRISPRFGSNVRTGLTMNAIRMVGGVLKLGKGGLTIPQKDLDYDPVLYDSINNVYVYRWEPLIERFDRILRSQTGIFQVVLDQAPWAFQHGYTFIPEGTRDNVNFRENERISIYGNSLPPANKQAYNDFIKALMTKLVQTYGEEKVLSWRFRVGSEIETPEHWYGTQQDFIDHFANTVSAVRSVLPNAKIGVHTRNPDFLFKNGTELNYKGQPFASFAAGLIDYNYQNNIKCDFWGLSDYIVTPSSTLRNMRDKYITNFAPLINNPKWNPNTTIDIMEYNTVTTMNGADGRGTIPCQSTHSEIVELAFSNMFYKNKDKGLGSIFRWRSREGAPEDPDAIKELNTLVGMDRYETSLSGNPKTATNQLDAIFAKNKVDGYDVLIYNYNSNSLNYVSTEAVEVSFVTDFPVGTSLYYRNKSYGKENNKLQNFLINNSSYLKSGYDDKGDPERTLTPEGFAAFEAYVNPNPLVFNQWKSVVTQARTDGGAGSVVSVSTNIGSFAFNKFEFRTEDSFLKPISPETVVWTKTQDFLPWTAVSNGMSTTSDNDKLSLTFSSGFSFPTAAITGLNLKSNFYGTLRVVVKNSTPNPDIQIQVNAPGTTFPTGRVKQAIPNDNQWHTIDINLVNWTRWNSYDIITELKFYNNVNSGILEFDSMEFIPRQSVATHTVTITKEGKGLLNYKSGSAFTGQEFSLNAIPEVDWKFSRWEGDVNSTQNPLPITVSSNMNIKAVFTSTILSVEKNIFNKISVFPNPSKTGVFNINSDTPQIWEVYSIIGTKIASGKGNVVDISIYDKGFYILKINNYFSKIVY